MWFLNKSVFCFSSLHEPEPLEANGIASRLYAGRYGFRISQMGKRFFSFPKRPDRLWSPPRFLLSGYRGSFPGVHPEGEADHLHPSGAEVRNEWSYPSYSPCKPSWHGTLSPSAGRRCPIPLWKPAFHHPITF